MRSALVRLIRSIVLSAGWSSACAAPARIAGAPAAPAANRRRDNIKASSSSLLMSVAITSKQRAPPEAATGGCAYGRQQAPSRIPPRRHELRLVDTTRLPCGHRTKDPRRISRRGEEEREPHPAFALRPRRLHDRTFRPRVLGGGLSDRRRSHRRQRPSGERRREFCGGHLCLPPARSRSRAVQIKWRLPPLRNPLFCRIMFDTSRLAPKISSIAPKKFLFELDPGRTW